MCTTVGMKGSDTNRVLLWKYRCHINVEVCSTLHAVKYLHKYISKGGDRAEVELAEYAPGELEQLDATERDPPTSTIVKNEIKEYIDGRYISTSEATWRAFAFPLHHNQSVL